ncbi:MAG: hypothetical protein WBA13_01365 [Microcoleaceae cyanobacterium]
MNNQYGRGANYQGELWYQSGKYVICDEGEMDERERGQYDEPDKARYGVYQQHDETISFNQISGDFDGELPEDSWSFHGYKTRDEAVDFVNDNNNR